ncbi:MAG: hypothetical protein NVS3B10_30970 [Polyangiales bacterium]
MDPQGEALARRIAAAFGDDAARAPSTSLRGGNSLDDYEPPPPYDPVIDAPTDVYLERYALCGLGYVDPESWRHYLPRLLDHALRTFAADGAHSGLVIQALLSSLGPQSSAAPRRTSLSTEQERVIVEVLEVLAFDARSTWQDEALELLLDEHWSATAIDERARRGGPGRPPER